MTQSAIPKQEQEEMTERDLAIKAQLAASGKLPIEEYFKLVRERAEQAVNSEVARYERAHPWWQFLLGIHARG